MRTEIYMVRHGQSVANMQKVFLGHGDLDLSDIGRIQAECLKKFFEAIDVDIIYSSDLTRAVNTVLPLSIEKGLEINKSAMLREIYAGKWEFMPFSEIREKYPKDYETWKTGNGYDIRPTDGESMAEVWDRVYLEVLRIARENEGKKIVIATHHTPLKTLAHRIEGNLLDNITKSPSIPNASVTKFVFENGELSLEYRANTSHLGELVTVLPMGI